MAGLSKSDPERSDRFAFRTAEPLRALVRLLARQAALQVLSGDGADAGADCDNFRNDGLTDDASAAAPETSKPTSRNPS